MVVHIVRAITSIALQRFGDCQRWKTSTIEVVREYTARSQHRHPPAHVKASSGNDRQQEGIRLMLNDEQEDNGNNIQACEGIIVV